MEDFERAFLAKTVSLRGLGVTFEEVAREALEAKFGGATDVLLRDLGPGALVDPNLFVRAMSKMFGRGALGVYEPIMKYLDMGNFRLRESLAVADIARGLGPSAGPGGQKKTIPLHDQRIKDEQDEYAQDAN